MKKILVLVTVLFSLLFVGCFNNGTSSKAIEEGKIALVSKEYDKAVNLFKLAVTEDPKNKDAVDLLDLTADYTDFLNVMFSGEFEKAEELIDKIENNKKLDIIKDDFDAAKNTYFENKETILVYINEIEEIEKLLDEGKYDDAGTLAKEKLEEIKEFPKLSERLSAVIKAVEEKNKAEIAEQQNILNKAKETILKYHSGNTDIEFWKMTTFNDADGIFSKVNELKGKTMYHFIEVIEDSPKEYVYDNNTGDVFKLDQGMVFWMNNKNKELTSAIASEQQDNFYLTSEGQKGYYLTREEVTKKACKKFEEDFPSYIGQYKAVCAEEEYAGCYEVTFFDTPGMKCFATYAVDIKSGAVFPAY